MVELPVNRLWTADPNLRDATSALHPCPVERTYSKPFRASVFETSKHPYVGIAASKPFVGNMMWVTSLTDPDGYRLDFESPTDVPEETEYSGQEG